MTAGQTVQGVAKPRIRYYEALRSWFVLADGSVHAVEFANSLDFWLFIVCCTAKKKYCRLNVEKLVKLLNYEDSGLTRWHIIEEMMQASVYVPLYDSAEDAMDSMVVYTTT